MATALSLGSTYIGGTWTAFTWDMNPNNTCTKTTMHPAPTALCDVRPTITSISPARGVVGATTRVTISGSGFAAGATVNAGSGATASIVSISSNSIVADFAVDGGVNAVDGPVAVTVTCNGQTSNNDKTFFHQVARHLTPLDHQVAPNGIAPLQIVVDGDLLNLNGQVVFSHFCGVGRNLLILSNRSGRPTNQQRTVRTK